MFTGIVQGKATVAAVDFGHNSLHLTIQLPDTFAHNLQKGASIAINGTCLTITAFNHSTVEFDVIGETLRLTNLGSLKTGDQVNFERAARIGDEIGGHQLSGHILATARLQRIERDAENCAFWLQAPAELMEYILPKGFIALNGCSLTIGQVDADHFSIHLIPETLEVTTFGTANVGDAINLEVDPQTQAIVETVKRFLNQQSS